MQALQTALAPITGSAAVHCTNYMHATHEGMHSVHWYIYMFNSFVLLHTAPASAPMACLLTQALEGFSVSFLTA